MRIAALDSNQQNNNRPSFRMDSVKVMKCSDKIAGAIGSVLPQIQNRGDIETSIVFRMIKRGKHAGETEAMVRKSLSLSLPQHRGDDFEKTFPIIKRASMKVDTGEDALTLTNLALGKLKVKLNAEREKLFDKYIRPQLRD